MRFVRLVPALFPSLLLGACGLAGPTSPGEVVREYCRLVNAGEFTAAAHRLDPALAQALLIAPGAPVSRMTLFEMQGRQWTAGGEIAAVEVLGQKRQGPAAIVEVRLGFRDGSVRNGTFALWLTEGAWRIASNSFAP